MKFQEIIPDEKIDREITTATTEIRKAIKWIKNKKSGDQKNWKTERIKEGRSEMALSLVTLFDRVEEKNKTAIQQRETKVKSVYKGGNKKA